MNRAALLGVVLWFTVTLAGFARADESSTNPPPITDPQQVSQHYHEIVTAPQYQEVVEADVNTRFKEWIMDWFRHLGVKFGEFKYASHMPAFESFLMSILVILSIAGLIYTMARLTRRRQHMEQEPPPDFAGPKTFRPPEFYDEEIRTALTAQDWHAAWLASWRQFLSRLENRHLVEADRTRTNREYLAQLKAQTLPTSAQTLLTGMVDTYDRFIYGRRNIGETDWELFHRQIGETSLMLNLEDKTKTPRARESSS